MEVLGKIKVISAEQQISPTFRKKELVVTTDEQYPQSIMIEFTQDKCDLLNGLNVGDQVTVSINLGGREWVNPQGETKYFNSIKGWGIVKQDAPTQSTPEATPEFATAPKAVVKADEPDDLPF